MTKKIRPALCKVEGSAWAWVSLAELSEVLGAAPERAWLNYFALTRNEGRLLIADGQGSFWTVFINGGCAPQYTVPKRPDPVESHAFGSAEEFVRHLREGTFYVPAGWSERVLEAVMSGVGSVGPSGLDLPRVLLRSYLDQF